MTQVEKNWQKIMLDPAINEAFYNVIDEQMPSSVEVIPKNIAPAYDGFSVFWGCRGHMENRELLWKTEIDTHMLPMDIVNPKGAS